MRTVFGYLALSALCFLVIGCDSRSGGSGSTTPEGAQKATESAKGSDSASTATASTPPATPATTTPPPTTPPPTNSAAVTGPSWVCEQAAHDFGTVWTGRMLIHPFVIKNVGTEPLRLAKPKAHCSCSSADSFPEVIEPGQSGSITYRLNMQNKAGPVHEALESQTNDPRKPVLRIEMNGFARTVCELEVVSDLAATEGRLPADKAADIGKARGDFGRVTENENLARVIRLKNSSGVPLMLQMLPVRQASVSDASGNNKSVPPMFDATFSELEPGQLYELSVTGKPPFANGYNATALNFKTGLLDQPTYTVTLYAYCPPRIEITPFKIVFNQQASTRRRPITIRNNGTTPIKVTSVACTDPNFSVTLLPPDPGDPTMTQVEVLIPTDPAYLPPSYGEIVRIETTDPEKAVIDIQVLPSLYDAATPRPADKPIQFHPGKMLQ